LTPEKLSQIPLRLNLPQGAGFDNFVPGRNREAVHALTEMLAGRGTRLVLLWGRPGSGKTHLLEAVCQHLSDGPQTVTYLPLSLRHELSLRLLDGLERISVICIDDVQVIAGREDWERALFDLYNRADAAGTRMLVSAASKVSEISFVLRDLASRLSSGVAYQLRELDDAGRKQALQRRAVSRGFQIPDAVADFLMHRQPRDMHALMALLDRLDRTTLAEKRLVTIPFVKRMLGIT